MSWLTWILCIPTTSMQICWLLLTKSKKCRFCKLVTNSEFSRWLMPAKSLTLYSQKSPEKDISGDLHHKSHSKYINIIRWICAVKSLTLPIFSPSHLKYIIDFGRQRRECHDRKSTALLILIAEMCVAEKNISCMTLVSQSTKIDAVFQVTWWKNR